MKDTFYNIPEKNKAAWLRADIDPQAKAAAKRLAKKRGMTLQGWLAQLIYHEIEQEKSRRTSMYAGPVAGQEVYRDDQR
ncbi:MAG TPA: hypothetical protein PLG17_11300 [Thermodesulfobacteriota bacterium]|jgi:hypothetical protein|nr:hypothetical protein [Thermodesulfobacteriota bacterium]